MYISFCKTTNILSILLIEMGSFVGGGGGSITVIEMGFCVLWVSITLMCNANISYIMTYKIQKKLIV